MSPKLAARVYATDIILGTEKHYRHWEEIKKKTTGAISHASKLCQSHWSLGGTIVVTYGAGES